MPVMSCGSPQQPSPPYGHNQCLPAYEIQPSNLYFTAQLSSTDWLSASLLQQVTHCTIKYQNMCEAKYCYKRRLLEFRTDPRRMLVKPTVMSTGADRGKFVSVIWHMSVTVSYLRPWISTSDCGPIATNYSKRTAPIWRRHVIYKPPSFATSCLQ